jgi:hypothetical protein
MNGRPRFIYHPAPGPRVDGRIVKPEPVDLGDDLEFALEWISHRLGIRRPAPDMPAFFTAEALPLAQLDQRSNRSRRSRPSADESAEQPAEPLLLEID